MFWFVVSVLLCCVFFLSSYICVVLICCALFVLYFAFCCALFRCGLVLLCYDVSIFFVASLFCRVAFLLQLCFVL